MRHIPQAIHLDVHHVPQKGRMRVPLRNAGSRTFMLNTGVDVALQAARGKRVLGFGLSPSTFLVALGAALGVAKGDLVRKVQLEVAEVMKSLIYQVRWGAG